MDTTGVGTSKDSPISNSNSINTILTETLQFIPVVIMILSPIIFEGIVFSYISFIENVLCVFLVDVATTFAVQDNAVKNNTMTESLLNIPIVIWCEVVGSIFYISLAEEPKQIIITGLSLIIFGAVFYYYFHKVRFLLRGYKK